MILIRTGEMWLDDVWIQFDFMTVKKLTRYLTILVFMIIYILSMLKDSDQVDFFSANCNLWPFFSKTNPKFSTKYI